jgi:hypothetical protein
MASAPVIQYLQLDPVNDPVFDPSANLLDTDAVAQAILTRLNLFLGEWWENLLLGLPVFQSILGQLGSQQGLAAMTLAVQQNIEGAPYVTSVASVEVKFVNGQLSIKAVAQTQFGTAVINMAPAISAASLETS